MPVLSRVVTGAGKVGGAGGGADPRLPDPTDCGQVMITLDGLTWESHKPVVALDRGWVSDANGNLIVEGWHPNG